MRQVIVAVAVTLSVQALGAMAMIAPAAFAPVVAADLGIPPQRIGLFVSASYFAAMLSGLACGPLLARYGAHRVEQAAVLLAAAGLIAGVPGWVPALLLSAACIGVGYGLVNPASSQILSRATPPHMMSIVFSIKQTGVPIGGAIAGALVPSLLLAFHWQTALLILAAIAAVGAIAIHSLEPVGGGPATQAALAYEPHVPWIRRLSGSFAAPVALVLRNPSLARLSVLSLMYSATQLGLMTYLISYLKLELGYTLVAAGLVFSSAQVAGIVARVVWGITADRWLSPRITLAVLGFGMAIAGTATALFSAGWPVGLIVVVAMTYGATAVGWNGVFLAEVARRAPHGSAGIATGGTQFFTFFGALIGPPAFGLVASLSGSYAWGYALVSVPPLAIAISLLRARATQPPTAAQPATSGTPADER